MRKNSLFEDINRDQQQFLKEVSDGYYTRNILSGETARTQSTFKSARSSLSSPKNFMWDTMTNKKTYHFDPKRVLKIKVVNKKKFRVKPLQHKDTKFTNYLDEISSQISAMDTSSRKSFLKPVAKKALLARLSKGKISPMKFFKNKAFQKEMEYSNKSIFQLANRFRRKSKKLLNVLNSKKTIVELINEEPGDMEN